FEKIAPALDVSELLENAGNYMNFGSDVTTWQVARFRHRLQLNTEDTDPDLRESGSLILVQFRQEEYFETLERDGADPEEEHLYIPNLEEWSTPEDPENSVYDQGSGDNTASKSYYILRRRIVEDPGGEDAPTFAVSPRTYTIAGTAYTYISGVQYFFPRDE